MKNKTHLFTMNDYELKKKVEMLLEEHCSTLCMDDEYDRRRMAKWIVDYFNIDAKVYVTGKHTEKKK